MSCVVTISRSEAIFEFWGSVTDKIVRVKAAVKKSDLSDTADLTVKFLFTKLVGPQAGANRTLYKRKLTLMFHGQDYVKHFMKPKCLYLFVISNITFQKQSFRGNYEGEHPWRSAYDFNKVAIQFY